MVINKKFAVVLALLGMISVQSGAGIAKQLFPVLGPMTTSFLRISLAAVLLNIILRPNYRKFTPQQWKYSAFYGLGMAIMNIVFYLAIQRIHLGLGVAIEFSGPLFLAFALSRRWQDILWAVLAATGILLIVPWEEGNTDGIGILLAFLAGTFWAVYILMGRKVSQLMPAGNAVAAGLLIATFFAMPFALYEGGLRQLNTELFILTLGVAILSSALPYTLDMFAISRLPAKTFSVITSLQPALGALSGLLFLHEMLSLTQCISILCVILASLGSTLSKQV